MSFVSTKAFARIAALLGLFVILEIVLVTTVDRSLSLNLRMQETLHPDVFAIFHDYTDFGKSVWYLVPSGSGVIACAIALRLPQVSILWRQHLVRLGNRLLFLFVAVAASGLLTDAIKPFIARARPVELQRDNLFGFFPVNFHAAFNSMPSGHATTSFTLMALGILWFPRWRILVMTLCALLAASRVMVNAHYLADVLAGGMVGLLTTAILHRTCSKNGIFPFACKLFPLNGLFPIDKETPPQP